MNQQRRGQGKARPERWLDGWRGKLYMLTAYYSKDRDSKEMFTGLEISKHPDFRKHLNQYDVIHLDIQWCMEPAGGPDRVVRYISEKTIDELREYYSEALPEGIRSLTESLLPTDMKEAM